MSTTRDHHQVHLSTTATSTGCYCLQLPPPLLPLSLQQLIDREEAFQTNPLSSLRVPRSLSDQQQLLTPPFIPATMLSALQNPRQAAAQLLNFALILSTAFMTWKGLSVIADSPSPIVVVLSGSMEPAFQRGDLLFLWNRNVFEETKVGEIVVYNVKGKDIPIVHRLVRKFGTG